MGISVLTGNGDGLRVHVRFGLQGNCPPELEGTSFSGKFLELFPYMGDGSVTVYIGLGEQAGMTEPSRQIAVFAKASAWCGENGFQNAAIHLNPELNGAFPAENVSLGLALGLFKRKESDFQSEYQFVVDGIDGESLPMLNRGLVLGEAVCGARRMTDCPPNRLRPADFAEKLTKWLQPLGVECLTIAAGTLKEMGMNGLAGIGCSAGANAEPCLFVMRYRTDNALPHTGLIGKGVTFDSGGTCLKSAASMTGAKGDMAGGAAVAGAIYALAKNGCAANVTGIIPMCENRLSADSFVPGDVYRSYSGKTVEVLNTDAEGRLILADAVAYAIQDEGCGRIIDIATLTGAVVTALGFTVAGAVTNNVGLWKEFEAAANRSGERYWLFPTDEEYKKMLESDFADIKNTTEGNCSTIAGGLFIGAFAEKVPWLHLDIAGTASVDKPYTAYQTKGATGAGVLSLYRFLAR